MTFDDGRSRGRLLTGSSTRAFAALRDRANTSLARIRLAASTAFCLIAGILALTGEIQQMDFWPLLAYLEA